MDKYEVMIYPRALKDIDDIYAYIALEKLSPENAKEQTDRIWKAVLSHFSQFVKYEFCYLK